MLASWCAVYIGIEHIVVFLNKVDLVDDEGMRDLAEMEIRDFLADCGYPEDVPIIGGSAKTALLGDESRLGAGAIKVLIRALDSYIPKPAAVYRSATKPHAAFNAEICMFMKAEGGRNEPVRENYEAVLQFEDM